MKKVIIGVLITITLLTSCVAIKDDNNTNDISNNVDSGDNSIEIDDSFNSKKQIYIEKINKLKSDLESTFNERYESPNTIDMVDAANSEYKLWDDMLNEIYSVLKEQLSKEQMENLKEEQLKWLKIRDEKSVAAEKENEGGTMATLNKFTSLIETTRDRSFELVNQYMK